MKEMVDYKDPKSIPECGVIDNPADHYLDAMCPHCGREVDAVCPCCGVPVESAGATDGAGPDGPEGYRLRKAKNASAEFIRNLLTLLGEAKNTKFMLRCFLVALGDGYANGVTMTKVAQENGVTKADVSKQCRAILKRFGLKPSQYMLREEASAVFRLSNRRPTKTKK